MCFIEFLNEYTGAFTVLLTLILVIINIYMGWQNHVLRKDTTRPKIWAEVNETSGEVRYKFINYGTTSAVNMRIRIDPFLVDRVKNSETLSRRLERIEKCSFSLLPGDKFEVPTGSIWMEIQDRKISLSYTYEDLSGNSYSEKYLFDLSELNLKITSKD